MSLGIMQVITEYITLRGFLSRLELCIFHAAKDAYWCCNLGKGNRELY